MGDASKFSVDANEAVMKAARLRDRADDAVIATDATGRIVYWNSEAEALYGWPAQDILGHNILDVTPTRRSGEAAAQIMENMRQGDEWDGEFIVKHRDGTPMIAHVRNFLVRDRGAVVGFVGVSRRTTREGTGATPAIAD